MGSENKKPFLVPGKLYITIYRTWGMDLTCYFTDNGVQTAEEGEIFLFIRANLSRYWENFYFLNKDGKKARFTFHKGQSLQEFFEDLDSIKEEYKNVY